MYADCLYLRVVIQSICSQLSAQSGLLESTEWHLVVKSVVVVDPNSSVMVSQESCSWDKKDLPCFNCIGHSDSGIDICGMNSRGKP